MINKDGGGGGQVSDFMGGHSCYEGDIELMRGSPQSPPLGKTLKVHLQLASCHHWLEPAWAGLMVRRRLPMK